MRVTDFSLLMLAMGSLGIFLIMFEQTLYDRAILLDVFGAGALLGLQSFTMVFLLFIGVIVGAKD